MKRLIQKLEQNRWIETRKTDRNYGIRSKYNYLLWNALNQTRKKWLSAERAYRVGSIADDEMVTRLALAKQKYLYLYQVARERHVRGRFNVGMFKN